MEEVASLAITFVTGPVNKYSQLKKNNNTGRYFKSLTAYIK